MFIRFPTPVLGDADWKRQLISMDGVAPFLSAPRFSTYEGSLVLTRLYYIAGKALPTTFQSLLRVSSLHFYIFSSVVHASKSRLQI